MFGGGAYVYHKIRQQDAGVKALTSSQAKKVSQLKQMMVNGGLGEITSKLHITGTKDLASDDPTTTAYTRPGAANIGSKTVLDDDFFCDNHGNDRLQTIIHESLHAYFGAAATLQGDSEDTSTIHGRISLWAQKFNGAIRNGKKAQVPVNLNAVIKSGAKPIYH